MRFVSPFLKTVLYPTLAMSGVFRRISACAPGLAVVTYHGVLPEGYKPVDSSFDGNLITPTAFRKQLRRLKTHYKVIAPADVLAWLLGERALPPQAVLLTCDDGLLNCLTDMLPVLQEEQLKCLFFITGASITEASTAEGSSGEERSMLWYEELYLLLLRASETPTLRKPGRVGQPDLRQPDARQPDFEITCVGITISGSLGPREQRHSTWWSCVKRLSQVDAETRNEFLRAMREQLASSAWRGFDSGDAISSRRFGLMTRSELRQLVSAGMTIGAHTLTHPILAQLPVDIARAEITESRTELESVLRDVAQEGVWAFAYPFGDAQSVTPKVLALPEQAGYAAAFLNYGGGLGTTLPPYALPRIHVTSKMSLAELEAHVSGFHAQLQRMAS